ncbi:MAG: rRNA ((966)-N(2))-methyltransferase RsmD [Pseudomonadota bacterium]|jgi:16S rRNA (guanine(966)-N(2))-methyltransferase RsmD
MTPRDKPAGSGGRSTRAGASGRSGAARTTGPLEVATARHDRKTRPAITPPVPAVVPHEVRLIGGLWKRTKLPVADRPGLRPTPDRVRETLFNWLGQDLSGWRVLDAFAGTGALGFEAASRGATQVVLIENDAALIRSLNASRLKLAATQLAIHRGEALVWMRTSPALFDLVLLDPPFEADLFDQALTAATPRLAPGGLIYLESDRDVGAEILAALGLELWRQGRAGRVHFHLLRAVAPVMNSPSAGGPLQSDTPTSGPADASATD